MDRTWKKAERKVAAFYGVRRNPLSGINSGHTGADTIDPDFYNETKYRGSHAALTILDNAVSEAVLEDGNKIPVVALVGSRRPGFGVLVRSVDLERFCLRYLNRLGYTVRPKR